MTSLLKGFRDFAFRRGAPVKIRPCPDCTTSISVAAKRCPHCTSVVAPVSTQ